MVFSFVVGFPRLLSDSRNLSGSAFDLFFCVEAFLCLDACFRHPSPLTHTGGEGCRKLFEAHPHKKTKAMYLGTALPWPEWSGHEA